MVSHKSTFFLLLVSFLLIRCQPSESVADLVIYDVTMYSGTDQTGEAIAAKDGKIIAIGDDQEIRKYENNQSVVIDGDGAFLMPGFIEGHGHYSSLGASLMNLNFLRSKSWDEIVAMVKDKVEVTPKGEWIIGRGWHQEKWTEPVHDHVHGYPKHFQLSDISPDHPVLLTHASGHGVLANQKAMDIAGVSKETPNPAGGEIVRDETGVAIGVFEERAAKIIWEAYNEYLETLSAEEKLRKWNEGITLAEKECFENGITSFQDAGSSFDEIMRYKTLAEEGTMKIRLWAMLRESSDEMKDGISNYRMIGVGDDRFTCRAIKTELDGALGAFGAWLLEPYNDKPGFYGQNTTSMNEVQAIAQIAYDHDMQLCVHAIGDRANRETLNILEEFFKKIDGQDLRWRNEHSQHIHPDDIPRFAELGCIASMQAIHCTSDAPFVEKRLGRERAQNGAYNWRKLLDAGAVVTNGTDAPVEDVNPIESFYASVTRKRIDNSMEFFTENKMTRQEALYSYTQACAYAAFEEDIKGSLEVGKLADMILLSKNLLTCTDAEILETEIIKTIVGGEVVFTK